MNFIKVFRTPNGLGTVSAKMDLRIRFSIEFNTQQGQLK